MNPLALEKLKYPIGVFVKMDEIDQQHICNWIKVISDLPQRLRMEVEDLNENELLYQYRPESWTVKQVVHHLADSHMNSFIRFKLAITEDTPIIKPYFEERWAELPDAKESSVESSLLIIEGVHQRWVDLLNSLSEEDFNKEFYHPQNDEKVPLVTVLNSYAWHSEHHLAHIRNAKTFKSSF